MDLVEQEIVSGSGISSAISKSAPHHQQIAMPASHHSDFLQAGCPSCSQINSVQALKAYMYNNYYYYNHFMILWTLSEQHG